MPTPPSELIAQARARVKVLAPDEAAERLREEPRALLLDVREPDEHAKGALPGARHVPRGVLEMRIVELCPEEERPIFIHCQSGARAVLAADTLQRMGYRRVYAIEGSFDDLRACGACCAGGDEPGAGT